VPLAGVMSCSNGESTIGGSVTPRFVSGTSATAWAGEVKDTDSTMVMTVIRDKNR